MLGRVLFVLYVAAVLLISGFAKADQVSQMVPTPRIVELNSQVVSFQENNFLVRVKGTINNGCIVAPYPMLRPSTQDSSTYVLTVVAKVKGDMCPQVMRGQYDMAFDLRSVFYNWSPEKIQSVKRIISADSKFVLPIDGSEIISAFPFAETQAHGMLVPMGGNKWGVLTEGDKVVTLKGVGVDFENYKNKIVVVTGHAFPASNPIFDVNGTESSDASTSPSKVLAVSGISAL